ncbi:unnamed protein product [Effrenium voratum]|uniref:Uncharacterized protein n=1 Tax=Effrenium voratum TaxID=2562239 RepID=A0AA36HLV6_9DINO|nr:unnamed protein product [Effrenium voratum]CAJ1370990.1 unnamed protein product [Effrenium voratum]CAJ1438942.1 unnamed protein product [Effrenium voratum]|mmetsp:Transcript_22190/g.52791  ORF Transcript_22190/g.52791 Transcript_22190/m.52791 type:complete len:361 (-) Transcript_22190:11-1093(-)
MGLSISNKVSLVVVVWCTCAAANDSSLIRRSDVSVGYDGKLESHPHHHRHHRAHRKPSPRVQLKMDQVKEIPHCDQEYSCDAQRTKHLGDFARKRIAVYTYNIGSYEGGMREDNVPCVPNNIDAFVFLDDDTKERSDDSALNLWRKQGWQVKPVTLQAGSEFVTGARLTSKLLKFTPPSWLLNGDWEWLAEFDGNVVLDLHTLGPFLDKYESKPLMLLDWSYHEDCSDDGFQCFSRELHSMLHSRQTYIEDSKENIVAWESKLTKEHEGSVAGTRKYAPPYYYETRIILRNLRHSRSKDVSQAFGRTYEKCHQIQRDQFLVPYFLWHANLSFDTEALPMRYLVDTVGMCMVKTRVGRNLL